MKVDYINHEIVGDHVRVIFIGYDPTTGKRRRPVIDLDVSDLRALIEIVARFRRHEVQETAMHSARVTDITRSFQESIV